MHDLLEAWSSKQHWISRKTSFADKVHGGNIELRRNSHGGAERKKKAASRVDNDSIEQKERKEGANKVVREAFDFLDNGDN